MKSARVYSVTKWYAKCPDCKTEYHVRDDAPPFFAEQIHCARCNAVFEADLEDRIAERRRIELMRLAPLQETPRPTHEPRPTAQLDRITDAIKRLGSKGCSCKGAEFGQHGLYCETKKRERSVEW